MSIGITRLGLREEGPHSNILGSQPQVCQIRFPGGKPRMCILTRTMVHREAGAPLGAGQELWGQAPDCAWEFDQFFKP